MNEAGSIPDEDDYYKIENGACVESNINTSPPSGPCDSTKPVCDYNGEYFANECDLNAAGSYPDEDDYYKIENGTCKDPFQVPHNPSCNSEIPVCDYYGEYFESQCALIEAGSYPDDDNFYSIKDKKCVESTDAAADCDKELLDPVCSFDGTYYKNMCLFSADGAYPDEDEYYVAVNGQCKPAEKSPLSPSEGCDNDTPVCSYDGNFFNSECALLAAQEFLDSDGYYTIKNKKCVQFTCGDIKGPVCSQDGEYFENACLLEKSGEPRDILADYVVKNKQCLKSDGTTDCGDEYAPICSKEGIFYENECQMKNDGSVKDNGSFKIDGEECIPKAKTCKNNIKPVCSVDGIHYQNKCKLLEAGKQLDQGKFEAQNGKCVISKKPCTKEFKPVCSKDGRLFANKCVLVASGAKLDDGDFKVVGKKCIRSCDF